MVNIDASHIFFYEKCLSKRNLVSSFSRRFTKFLLASNQSIDQSIKLSILMLLLKNFVSFFFGCSLRKRGARCPGWISSDTRPHRMNSWNACAATSRTTSGMPHTCALSTSRASVNAVKSAPFATRNPATRMIPCRRRTFGTDITGRMIQWPRSWWENWDASRNWRRRRTVALQHFTSVECWIPSLKKTYGKV